ncbi:uncharacterized protein LOC127081452 [Lathyrus oleraceus]|uniref:uncharacterized protein LOC127081452 n=1 Tax=Pisum sativum TaxID=3888 RepID=UPI0021CE7816|nr:uncharacterized protein LOC127081452 [Pisum sativum]
MERELVDLFMGTLQGVYYGRLVGFTAAGFPDLVTVGEHVEVGIKLGNIQFPSSRSSFDKGKKPFTGFSKKKEDSSVAYVGKVSDPLHASHDPNVRCVFHSGGVGHDIENCWAFKHKVQDLIDNETIEFESPNGPNVVQNPMPPHGGAAVSAIEVDEELNMIMDCNGCDCLASAIQNLINEGSLQFDRMKKKVVEEVDVITIPVPPKKSIVRITLPGPVPYSSDKDVPWNYGEEVYYQGKKVDVKTPNSDVNDVGGTVLITRSGRVFSPVQKTPEVNVEDLAKAKGKRVVVKGTDVEPELSVPEPPVQSTQPSGSNSGMPSNEEVEELMRYIQKSDYRLLNTSFVPQEISVNQFEHVVASITASNGLGFTDFDFPPEGRKHNKALHISLECTSVTLSRVLVDTGSSLNVLPKAALMNLNYQGVEIRPSDLMVRAFDGFRRAFFGEVDLPIKIGPQVFTANFFVMDIQSAYCCLLGRPWIHEASVVTSRLHQKLKYPIGSKIVTVCSEKDYVIRHLNSFRYVEVEGEIHETPFQAFEVVHAIKIPHVKEKKPEISMSSFKQAQAVMESEHPEGWGRVLELPTRKDKCGLGFKFDQEWRNQKKNSTPETQQAVGPIKFISAGKSTEEDACVVEDEVDSDYDLENWIHPTVPRQELSNWTSEELITVTRVEE